jgi:integrase
MTVVRLKYLHAFRDRHGHPRYYFRFRGQRWPIPAPGEEGFATAYNALLAQITANPFPAPRNVAFVRGSLGWTIERFLASQSYADRAETTRRNYRRVLDVLRERYGAGLLKDLEPRHVKVMRNEIRDAFTTTAADIAVGLISTLWDFAEEELNLQLDADPTYGVRRVHRGKREHEPWPQELIESFMLTARPSLRWAVRLALYTGQRRSDVVKMMWSQFDGEFIEVCQQKTDELLAIPCHKVLRAELETMPRRGDTILVGERGGPLTAASLSVMVRRTLRGMGVTGYSIHGLRKNAGKALAEAGCGEREIMAILGHKTFQMVMHYTKRANQRVLARSAMDKLERAESGKPKNITG